MKTGQRVNLIKKLAASLAAQKYAEGDMILRQFGLPWTDTWNNGGSHDYYLAMLEQGDATKLRELHDYLFPGDSLPGLGAAQESRQWARGTLRLFLSHSATKKLLMSQLKQELAEFGIEAFVAHEDIEPSREWLDEIELALGSCHAFAAVLCEEFKKSNYCDQEVGYALQREVLVIPVRLEIDPYGFMAPLQGVSAFNKAPNEIAADIKKLLEVHPTTQFLMAQALNERLGRLVDDFLCSSSYTTSTRLLKQIEAFDFLPKRLVDKIAANWEENDQIYGCLGIPGRMKAFLRYHHHNEFSKEIRKPN